MGFGSRVWDQSFRVQGARARVQSLGKNDKKKQIATLDTARTKGKFRAETKSTYCFGGHVVCNSVSFILSVLEYPNLGVEV